MFERSISIEIYIDLPSDSEENHLNFYLVYSPAKILGRWPLQLSKQNSLSATSGLFSAVIGALMFVYIYFCLKKLTYDFIRELAK